MSEHADDGSPPSPPPLVDELNALPPGTRFGQLEILRTLGVGGFGIVYLAQDHALERQVAIKEYMPGQLARRAGGSQVSVRSGPLLETFELGRRSFVNEARLLARFDHRSLLKVYQFWEAHGTAYMAMPYLQGQTLKQARQAMSEPPGEAWLLRRLLPLIEGVALLHGEQVFHRDIAPDNILLPADGGDPILLDFGAARRVIGDRSQTFTAILKPSYAPIEQYAESAGLRQGAWTDVYALGAVVYYLLLGRTPPPATTRAIVDEYQPLAGMDLPGLSPHFRAAIDWALGVRPADRPQSMAQLRAALLGEAMPPAPPEPRAAPSAPAQVDLLIDLGRVVPGAEIQPPRPAVIEEATLILGPPAAALPVAPARRPSRALPALGLMAVLGLSAAGLWWGSGTQGKSPEPQALPPAPALVAAAAEPAASAASQTEAKPVAEPSAEPPASAAAAVPAAIVPQAPAPKPSAPRIAPYVPPRTDVNSKPMGTVRSAGRELPAMPRADSSLSQPVLPAEVARAQPALVPAAAAAASAVAATTATTAASAPADPREACGKRLFIAQLMCVDRECKKPAFAAHPECVRLREIEEQRGRRHER